MKAFACRLHLAGIVLLAVVGTTYGHWIAALCGLPAGYLAYRMAKALRELEAELKTLKGNR